MTRKIVAAYAAAPGELTADRAAESEWYDALRAEPLVEGLELAFTAGLHPRGSAHLSSLLDDRWALVVTNIRRTMGATHRNPAYGLASIDKAGRSAAVNDVNLLRQHMKELARPVMAVELHSAPHRGRAPSAPEQLLRSLEEILSWDWAGARVVLEHCDAFRQTGNIQKGYLALEEEICTIESLSRDAGEAAIALNWGRSAIETASANGPEEHIARVSSRVPLAGFFFSGAAAIESAYGDAWRDVHLPMKHNEPTSLLTETLIASSLRLLPQDIDYIGVKVTASPGSEGIARLGGTKALLEEIDRLQRGSATGFGERPGM
jgi:hypothetical protein